jgi:hypothetical protein
MGRAVSPHPASAVRAARPVFLPAQPQGHARPFQLGMQRRPVRLRPMMAGARGRHQPSFERPSSSASGSGQINPTRAAGRRSSPTLVRPILSARTQDVAEPTRRQPLGRHGAPRIPRHGARPCRRFQITSSSAPTQQGGRLRQIRWPQDVRFCSQVQPSRQRGSAAGGT